VRTLTYGQLAGADYSARVEELRDYAQALEGDAPLRARNVRHCAALLRRAARAELIDPEPVERRCGLCGGTDMCDIARHIEEGA
jgi:hypothetical protein